VAGDIGYELRCAPPGGFDIHYCRGLGYWATRFLLDGGTEAMLTIQGERCVPVPFADLIDTRTGRFRVRYVDVTSEAYGMLAAYMIRLNRADLDMPDRVRALADAARLDEEAFIQRFSGVVDGRKSPV
jgi:6-phosphofructokinase 1